MTRERGRADRRPHMHWSWSEARYLDRWVVVHLLSGIAGGFSNVFLGLQVRNAYALGLALMIAWEAGEAIGGVRETWANRIIDVGIGLAGVWFAFWTAARVDRLVEIWLFSLSTTGSIVTSIIGFKAYRRRVGDQVHQQGVER